MKIYTFFTTSESFSKFHEEEVVGSFMDSKKAKRAMIENIIARAQNDQKFAYAMWKDENHQDFKEVMLVGKTTGEQGQDAEGLFDRDDDSVVFPDDVKSAMFGYLNAEIANDCGAYFVYAADGRDREDTYRFEIWQNNLEP